MAVMGLGKQCPHCNTSDVLERTTMFKVVATLKKKQIYFMCMWWSVIYVHCVCAGVCGGQKKVSDLLELESETIESCLVLVGLGRDLSSSPEQHVSLTTEPSVQSPVAALNFNVSISHDSPHRCVLKSVVI